MHVQELVEFAALVSAHSPTLVQSRCELSPAALAKYWTSCRSRFDRWASTLKNVAPSPEAALPKESDGAPVPNAPRRATALGVAHLKSVLEEILASEVLTRVWAGVSLACDRRRGSSDALPIARSVLAGHVEARNRALKRMAQGPGVSSHDAVHLNRLRRRSERWTDLLLGQVATIDDVSELAFQPSVARDFADDLRGQPAWSTAGEAWPLVVVSLRASFRHGFVPSSPSADLNASIAAAILGCFPSEMFDSTGLARGLWMTRLAGAADDVQGLVAELFRTEPDKPPQTERVVRTRRRE